MTEVYGRKREPGLNPNTKTGRDHMKLQSDIDLVILTEKSIL